MKNMQDTPPLEQPMDATVMEHLRRELRWYEDYVQQLKAALEQSEQQKQLLARLMREYKDVSGKM